MLRLGRIFGYVIQQHLIKQKLKQQIHVLKLEQIYHTQQKKGHKKTHKRKKKGGPKNFRGLRPR